MIRFRPASDPAWLPLRGLRRWSSGVAVGLAAIAGCQTIDLAPVEQQLLTATVEPVIESAAEPETAATAVDPALIEDFRRWLDQDAWQVDIAWSVSEPHGPCPNRPWRWIFIPSDSPNEPVVKPTKPVADGRWTWLWHGDVKAARENDFEAAVAALKTCRMESGRMGVNATILLARLQPDQQDDVTDTLRAVCESGHATPQVVRAGAGIDSTTTPKPPPTTRASINTRCAAAEAWCRRLIAAGEPYETTLSPAGRLLQMPGLPDELRGTVWRCLSPRMPPDRLPALAETCVAFDQTSGPATSLQRAAMESCVIAAWQQHESSRDFVIETWPPAIESARRHSDATIRKLFGRWLALSGHPEMLPILNAQRHDTDPQVREAAIASLGLSKQAAAREQLEHVARHGSDRDRVTGVEALAAWGPMALEPFVTADAVGVRAGVARGLRSSPDAASDRMLRRLLTDLHPDVQAAALVTARQWPADWAIPALLEALRGSSLAVRQDALVALRDLTHEEPPVSIEALPEVRDLAVRQWAAVHGWRIGGLVPETAPTMAGTVDQSLLLAALDEILQSSGAALQGDAWDQLLTQSRPADVAMLERKLLDSRSPTVETVRRELLPRLDESYAALRDLTDGDIRKRREAARRLETVSRSRTLSPALLRSLHAVLLIEQDQVVWQHCLEAVQADGHDEAAQLALLAVHHTWPDIRRLGVAYIALHPTPEAAGWLMPLFRDDNRAVQESAIAAAAKCGNPVVLDGYPATDGGGPTGLRPLLTSADHELRWTVLETMAALRDDQAAAELIRLSYDPHPRVREQAAGAMGKTGDSRFVEALIRWSWTESADPVKQAILSSLDELTPGADRPETASGLAAPPTIDDKIKHWAAWWERHPPRTDAVSPSSAVPESRPTS